MNYTNYHKHSCFSNVIVPDSPVYPEDYAKRAVELNQTVLSCVEHGYQGRYIEYYELAKKYNLKFLFGTEAYIVKNRFEKDNTNAHIILLAKNENGRKAINRILSEANITGFYYRPRIDLELLFSLPKEDVWITTACIAGLWKYESAVELILQINEYFKGNFFLEVQCHNTESQKKLNSLILDLSNHYNIPIIFGSDSHYIFPEQAKERDDYLLSKHVKYDDEDGWYMDYPSVEDVVQRFQVQGILNKNQINEAIENTNIFESVEEYISEVFNQNLKLPTLYPEKTQDEKNNLLEEIIWSEWNKEKENVPETKIKHYEEEISKELSVITETGMADYFLLDYEIVKKGKELGGHLTLTGRGSAPSFYTSKLLGFTTVDRISASVKLFPERFITKERILEAGTIPDIDFNIGNPEVFVQAQKEILGEDHSYPMLAYGTLRPKAAWKLYARAMNIDFETANHVSEQIDKYELELKHTSEDDKDSINALDFIDPEYTMLYQQSTKYLGLISDFKIHPCAYLLYDKNIKEEIGLIKIKDNLCSLMDGLWAEKYHFLKNDLLKVVVVEMIHRIYEKIFVNPHPLPELIKICNKDKKTWDIYANAWTYGINQVEQTGTSGRVAKYKPQNISELSAFVAAVRPGFKSNYKQFESREPFSYGISSLDSIIQTKEFPQSFLLFQENSMQVMSYAGIPISQSYETLKNIAKKRAEKVLKYKDIFLAGMKERIIKKEKLSDEESEKIAHTTWQIIEDSSKYQFNASHAYSVAGDSLYGAYLKSHYPIQFYEVFLNMLEKDGDKDRLSAVISEAQRAFKINFPLYKFGQDNRYIKGNVEKWEITSSLKSIKGFNEGISNELYELGQNKYNSFLEFLIDAEEKGYVSKKYEELIKINYFDCFGNNGKLLDLFQEFSTGKSKYCKSYVEKTKEKRIGELKNIWEMSPDEKLPILDQIVADQEILGYISMAYPQVDKKFVFITSLDTKFAPRCEAYCLSTGKAASLKIQKRIYENNMFGAGEILKCNNFEKKRPVKFLDGKYVEDETGDWQWWISSYQIIDPKDFDKIIKIGA